MHLRDAETVAGDADMTHESFVTGGEECGDRPVVAERRLPLVLLDEAVELDQIDGVNPHAFERALEFGAGIVGGAAPVFVAKNTSSRWLCRKSWRRISLSPYIAAVSM